MSEEEHPLFFYYASETTGSDPLEDHIIEMASTVEVDAEDKEFSMLVSTTKEIQPSGEVSTPTTRDDDTQHDDAVLFSFSISSAWLD